MRQLKRVESKCKCPYCGYVNVLSDKHAEWDFCEHMYEVIKEDDGYNYFYFYQD